MAGISLNDMVDTFQWNENIKYGQISFKEAYNYITRVSRQWGVGVDATYMEIEVSNQIEMFWLVNVEKHNPNMG